MQMRCCVFCCAEGMYSCPVTGKVFTEHTHIAAVKTTGNVYAYEAVGGVCFTLSSSNFAAMYRHYAGSVIDRQAHSTKAALYVQTATYACAQFLLIAYSSMQLEELNIKPKNWKDLLTDEPFTRKDIIHLQDPLNLQVAR